MSTAVIQIIIYCNNVHDIRVMNPYKIYTYGKSIFSPCTSSYCTELRLQRLDWNGFDWRSSPQLFPTSQEDGKIMTATEDTETKDRWDIVFGPSN